MKSLAILELRSNLFHGDIQPELFRLPEHHVLDLSENNFSGNIPPELGSIASMKKEQQYVVSRDYILRRNLKTKWKGKYYNFTTTYLTSIDLSSNHLSGQIPEDITNLLGLAALNLANNYLDGYIPAAIGNMKQLESLDLSMNRLTGPIPPSLASLNFLSWLNLSYNNLSGPILTGPQLQTINDPSIYRGNMELCGDVIGRKCSTIPDTNDPPEHNNGDSQNEVWVVAGSIILRFLLGFWGIIGFLALKKSWRSRFFHFIDCVNSVYLDALGQNE